MKNEETGRQPVRASWQFFIHHFRFGGGAGAGLLKF